MPKRASPASSRRNFLVGLALAGCAGGPLGRAFGRMSLGLGQPAQPVIPGSVPPARFFSWREIAPGVMVAMSAGLDPLLGGNSTLVLGKDEAALFDTKYAAVGACLRREAGQFGRTLKRVVVTHHHADHTGGNFAFTPDVPVVSHAKAKPRVLAQLGVNLESIPGHIASIAKVGTPEAVAVAAEAEQLRARSAEMKPEQFAPTQTIDADANIEVGGVKVQLRSLGPAHTDNDLAIWLPELNVLHTGDLVFAGFHAFLDRPGGGSSAGWIDTVDRLRVSCNEKTVVVPGHGEPTTFAALSAQSEYLSTLRALVADAVKAGKSRDEASKSPMPAAYAGYGLSQLYTMTLGAIFDEMTSQGK